MLSLYWGVLFRVEQNLSSLVVWVVDFDGQEAPYNTSGITPIVGPAMVKAAQMLVAPTGALGWGPLPPSHFNNDPLEVRQRIYDYKAWAAIIVNANATALLQEAIRTGNTSYDPMGAAQLIYVQARDETTHSQYVLPQLQMFQTQVTSSFGKVSKYHPAKLGSHVHDPSLHLTDSISRCGRVWYCQKLHQTLQSYQT